MKYLNINLKCKNSLKYKKIIGNDPKIDQNVVKIVQSEIKTVNLNHEFEWKSLKNGGELITFVQNFEKYFKWY